MARLVVDGHHDGEQRVRERRGPAAAHAAPVALRVVAPPAQRGLDDVVELGVRRPKPSARARAPAEATSRGGSPGRRGPDARRHRRARDALDGLRPPRAPSGPVSVPRLKAW